MFTSAAQIRTTHLARLALVVMLGAMCVACAPTATSGSGDFLNNIDYSGPARGYTDTIDP